MRLCVYSFPVTLLTTCSLLSACGSADTLDSVQPRVFVSSDRRASAVTRPQLSPELAERETVLTHLEWAGDFSIGPEHDPWDPRAGVGDGFVADLVVAQSGGTHTSIASAVADATRQDGTDRVYIHLARGTYRESVCVPREAPPITLYSSDGDASQAVIVFDNGSLRRNEVDEPAYRCNPSDPFAAHGNATFAIYSPEFQAINVTFENDFEGTDTSAGTQAPALMTAADRLIFENVRVISHHGGVYATTTAPGVVERVYFKDCYVEGNEDVIAGRASAVLDHCTIHHVSSPLGSNIPGFGVAPSTDARNAFGILVIESDFTAATGTPDDSVFLGRAWDESQVDLPDYLRNVASGIFPNGKAVVRDSRLGAHIVRDAPWAASAVVGRPYHSVDDATPANRLHEFDNSGPGSAAQ